MKKLFMLMLVFAMVIPMVFVTKAETVSSKPFYGLGWSDFDESQFPYLNGLIRMTVSAKGDDVSLSYGGGKITAGDIDEDQLDKMVQAMKKQMNSRPAGTRYIHFFAPDKAYETGAEHVVYLDYGVNQLKELTAAFFAKYYAEGGLVDGAIMCVLHTGMSSYYISTNDEKNDPFIYKYIIEDPRYKTEIRPMLEERGFIFYENVSDYTPEIYSISHNSGSKYAASRNIWDTVMRIRLNAYVTQWCYEPMAKFFPDVHVSDYQSTDNDAWLKTMNADGDTSGSGGNSIRAGNTSCQNFYAARPSSSFYSESNQPVYKNPVSYIEAVYEDSSFNAFLHDMNVAKQVYTSTDDGNVCFWISNYRSKASDTTAITNSPYYSEQVYHLNMLDPNPMVVFMPEDYSETQEDFDDSANVVNELLAELTRIAGFSDRKPIAVPATWNSEFVLSGMYANNRNIWRITPNISDVSKAEFKVDGLDPTFYIKGQTITFPGGKIIEDTQISNIGTCGYWVETAVNVMPVITNDADRLEKYPAYIENFESYAVGTELNTTNIQHMGAWTIQLKGSPLSVVADGDNHVLSITGNSVMKNKLIPANITAADSYALMQSWELTLTLPAGITDEETLTLLNYTASKQSADDGGFRVKGGKLYYSQLQENGKTSYLELLDVSAGGKFTLKRHLNFSDAENYTCDYLVYDKIGNQVACVKNVAIPLFSGKVNTIEITCKYMKSNVLLDDYTLRAVGATAELSLYDATFGTKIDLDLPQKCDTAYRTSWMNASSKGKTAYIMAVIYENNTLVSETVIKEIVMAAGADGVEIGYVPVKDGQEVKVYLKTTISDVTDEVDENTTPIGSNQNGLIVGAIALIGIVFIALVVKMIFFIKKNKNAHK